MLTMQVAANIYLIVKQIHQKYTVIYKYYPQIV